ncbi:MAG: TonB dependent receptor, partial [Flavitalea sp.]
MRQLLTLLTAILLTVTAAAQAPGNMQAPPSIGRIYGKVTDSTGKAVRDASVMLLQNRFDTTAKKNKEVLLRGITTGANGEFNMEDLPVVGELRLTITAVGYASYDENTSFMPKPGTAPAGGTSPQRAPAGGGFPGGGMPNFEKDLGKITLKADAEQLGVVTVTANTTRMRLDIDKKVFNVEQNLVTAGGTAMDVMRNVPSVNVDIDGNVTLRNAAPQIYVDGRPTTLTLDQIPADAIESVEVITNPSAKYDASGGNAGILNIILKKNKKSGYNGNINAGVDKRGAMNGGVGLSLRQNKFNLSLNGFANQMKNRNTNSTDITSMLTTPNLFVDQNTMNRQNGGFLFGRVGLDYFATNRLTFSVGAVRVHGEFSPTDVLKTDSSYKGGSYISYSERNTSTERVFNATGLQGGFKYLFPTKGEELTADINYFSGKNSNSANYNTDIYSQYGGAKTGNIQQQILGNGTNQFVTIQADYVKPFKGTAKLETGARVQLRNLTNNQGNYFYDAASGEFLPISSATSNYKNKDNVYAAYVSFSNTIRNFGYQVGLRAESSDYVGELTDTKQEFVNKYPVSLFPSIFLSQKLKNQQELQFSAT